MKPRTLGSLLVGATLLFSTALAGAPLQKKETHVVDPDAISWAPGPSSLPPGAEVALIDGDMTKKGSLFTIRLRMPDGYKVPSHFHPADEHVTVLSGTLYMGKGDRVDESTAMEMRPGTFHKMPKGMHHYAYCKGPTIIQVYGIGPWGITYVNPADDPRKKTAGR